MVKEDCQKRSKESVEEDIEKLQEWLEKQPHLPHNVEEEILSAFVHGTKSLEIAKRKLDTFYSCKNRSPNLFDFKNRDPTNPRFKELCQAIEQSVLSHPTPEGDRIIFLKFTEVFDKYFDHHNEAIRLLMLLELAMKTWPDIVGFYMIIDVKGTPANIATRLSPAIAAAFMNCFQGGFPLKMKGCFLINSPPFVEFVVNTIGKPIMKPKLFNRIKCTAEDESFVKNHLPMELLPSNYGGKDKSTSQLNDFWMKQLEKNREWFQFTSSQISNEKMRPPDAENTYGIEGTFRKLAVD